MSDASKLIGTLMEELKPKYPHPFDLNEAVRRIVLLVDDLTWEAAGEEHGYTIGYNDALRDALRDIKSTLDALERE